MSFTVHHPRIDGIKVEGLSAAERDAHKKAGWVSNESSADAPAVAGDAVTAAPQVTTDKPKRTRKK